MNKRITELRREINQIDDEILSFLVKRMGLVKQVGALKHELNLETSDTEREKEIIERLTKRANGRLSKDQLTRIFASIFELSKQVQKG